MRADFLGPAFAPKNTGDSSYRQHNSISKKVSPVATNRPSGSPSSNVLSSWKEIAAYVGRGVRTVQRWELMLGFPVRRPYQHLRSAVLALPEEIDAWVAGCQRRSVPAPEKVPQTVFAPPASPVRVYVGRHDDGWLISRLPAGRLKVAAPTAP